MILQDDNAGRAGIERPSPMGTGLPAARNCMPCGRHILNQVGGSTFRWHGVANVWHCAECRAKRDAKQKARVVL